jgi:hypothetical protein
MERFITSISCSVAGQSDLRESGCENERWTDLTQSHTQT